MSGNDRMVLMLLEQGDLEEKTVSSYQLSTTESTYNQKYNVS